MSAFEDQLEQRWANYGPQGSHTYIDSTYLESMLK